MKLKFELVNGFGVLVDREAEIKKDEFYISWEDSYTTPKWVIYCKSTGLNGKNPMKILFAEKELGLDVPVFEWRDFELENNPNIHDWVQEVILKEGKYWNDQDALEPVYYGVTKGYKSNPAKYTENDLREAIAFGKEQGVYYEFATQSDSSEDYVKGLQQDQQEHIEIFIQSLQKSPKYVVMESELVDSGNHGSGEIFHSNRIEEFTLFTNSEGKQQGIIKKLIWE